MAAIVLASLVVLMDTTFIVLALPEISADLGAGAEWAIPVFLMAMGISQLAAGWAAERFGQKRLFLASAAGFGLFAVAVAGSLNLGWLIAARSLQGLCAGMIVPLATSLAFSMFPEGKRATAVGISGTVVMLGPLIAPLLSGWVLEAANWRVLILIDVPFAVAVVGLGRAKLPHDPIEHMSRAAAVRHDRAGARRNRVDRHPARVRAGGQLVGAADGRGLRRRGRAARWLSPPRRGARRIR